MRVRSLLIALAVTGAALHPAHALDAIGEGRRAFMKFNCNGCHGGNAKGGMGPNIVGKELHDVTDAVMNCNALQHGMRTYSNNPTVDCSGAGITIPKGMAPVPTPPGPPTSTDLYNIVQYLGSIDTSKEPKWVDWWNANP